MELKTINIIIETEKFGNISQKYNFVGFIIKFNGYNHIITIHHYLPIHTVTLDGIQHEIKINSCWSEILILDINESCDENRKIFKSRYTINKKFQNKIPNKNDNLVLKNNNTCINLKMMGCDYIPYNNLPKGQKTIYILAYSEKYTKTPIGLSGSPVYFDNKLVGIFSKYHKNDRIFMIIPIYFVFKNLEKQDNDNIYHLKTIGIKKINSYNISKCKYYNYDSNFNSIEEAIFHPTFKIYIPLDTYYLLEGDNKLTCICQYTDKLNQIKKSELTFEINYNNDLTIEKKIQYIDTPLDGLKSLDEPESDTKILNYKLNLRLFILINHLGLMKDIMVIYQKLIKSEILNSYNIKFDNKSLIIQIL